jgi:O-antigen/teichoic acid export membrane protein
MILRHTAIYAFAQVATAVLGFLSLLIYTRLLSASEYGAYAVGIASVQMAHVALFGWLGASVNRFYPVVKDNRRGSFLATLGLSFAVVSLGAAILGLAGATLLTADQWRPLWTPCLGLLIAWAGVETVLSLARAELAPARFAVTSIGRAAIGLAVGGTLAKMGWGARGVLFGATLGCATPVVIEILHSWRYFSRGVPDVRLAREFAIYGIPVAVSFILEWVLSSSDRLLLAWLADTRSTGLYSAAYSLAQQLVQTGPVIVSLAMYPVIVRAYEQQKQEDLRRHLEATVCGMLALSVPAAVGLWVLIPNIAGTMLGSEYHSLSTTVVGTVAAGVVFSGLRTAYTSVAFFLSRTTAHLTWPLLAGAVVNIGVNLILIPRCGALGAGWATFLAYGVALLISVVLTRRTHPLPWPWSQLARIGVCTAVMGAVVMTLAHLRGAVALATQIGTGIGTYGGLFVALNVMGCREYVGSRWNRSRSR